MTKPTIATPANVPRIARVISYHPYRTARPWDTGRPICNVRYKMGDAVDTLERHIAATMGQQDNHHGWIVETPTGDRVFFYFSDWRLLVFSMPAEVPL